MAGDDIVFGSQTSLHLEQRMINGLRAINEVTGRRHSALASSCGATAKVTFFKVIGFLAVIAAVGLLIVSLA